VTIMADVLKGEHGGALDPLPTVAEKINALFDRAAKADGKAETYRISAGQELAKARDRVEAGEAGEITWTSWCADNIRRSEGDIRKVLAIANAADPAKALAAERQRNRDAIARHRAYVSAVDAKKGVAAGAGPTSVTIDTVKRDIQRLSAAKRLVLVHWLIEIVATDEHDAEAGRSSAMTQAAATMVHEEAAEMPLVSDGPAASVAADPPPQPSAVSSEATPEVIEPPETKADQGEEASALASAKSIEHQEPPSADPPNPPAAAPADLPPGTPQAAAIAEAGVPERTPSDALEGLL
jgi:hypothetical protein